MAAQTLLDGWHAPVRVALTQGWRMQDEDVEERKQQHQLQVEEPPDTGTPRIVCQRCHSLTHYGYKTGPGQPYIMHAAGLAHEQ